jgi:hypothetical protein
MYEWLKHAVRRGSTETLFGLNGALFRGITHEVNTKNPTGTWEAYEPISWTGGTGQMLAVNSPTAPTKLYMQLITGIAPTNNQVITGGTSAATCQVDTTVTERSVFFGNVQPWTYTGSLSGAYGVGVLETDLGASDKLYDLTNTERRPPDYVTTTVQNLVSGDKVVLGKDDSNDYDYEQFSADGSYTGGETSFVVKEDILAAPASGTFRVWNGTSYVKVTYTGWSGKTFTGCSGVPVCSDGGNVFLSYIDKTADGSTASFVMVNPGSPMTLYGRVRNGTEENKIVPYDFTVLLGQSASVSRRAD